MESHAADAHTRTLILKICTLVLTNAAGVSVPYLTKHSWLELVMGTDENNTDVYHWPEFHGDLSFSFTVFFCIMLLLFPTVKG